MVEGVIVVIILATLAVLVAAFGDRRERGQGEASPKPRAATPSQGLFFKSNAAFFQYQCKYGLTDIVAKRSVVALVLDSKEEAGTADSIKWNNDGSQLVMLRVASDDGGWRTLATTAIGGGTALLPGDLVAWLPLEKLPQALGEDPRSVWMGLIVAKLLPEIDGGTIKVDAYY